MHFPDAFHGQPIGGRRHAGIALADDEAFALVINDDGRGGRPGVVESLHVTHIDAFGLEACLDGDAGGVVADAAPQLGFAAEPGNGHGRIGRHAATGFDMLQRTHLGRLRRERLDAVDAVESCVADAEDAG